MTYDYNESFIALSDKTKKMFDEGDREINRMRFKKLISLPEGNSRGDTA